jgi:hypothetical protein
VSLLSSCESGDRCAGSLCAVWQVETIQGWTFASTLALLGVYLTVGALRGLVIGPSLEALAGMDGEVWTGQFDFTLLRPVDTQFLASVRKWRLFSLIDLVFGLVVIGAAVVQLNQALTPGSNPPSLLTLYRRHCHPVCHPAVLYCPGFLESRIPVHLGFQRHLSTGALSTGNVPGLAAAGPDLDHSGGFDHNHPSRSAEWRSEPAMLLGAVALAAAMVLLSSYLFRFAFCLELRRYSSAVGSS